MSTPADPCPRCSDAGRLLIYRTRRVAGGICYRYRRCARCGTRTVCRERTVTVRIGEPRVIGRKER